MAQHPYKGGWILLILVALNFFLLPATHSRLCSLCSSPCFAIHGNVEASIEQEIRGDIHSLPSPVPSQDETLGNSGVETNDPIFHFVITPIHVRPPCSSPCFAIHGNVESIYRTGNPGRHPPSLTVPLRWNLGELWVETNDPDISLRDQY
ncbi:hypothetical protein CEXT_382251 [Caerostris extrusa]|uniref:Uncharacterized protein n=1 Tax=Caerostris extrusa TaxID=172846 RepID=A0AAV4NJQ3_CAEEX|nr:hypothetical protein CEXT_382251 [Caerostris extrusa]